VLNLDNKIYVVAAWIGIAVLAAALVLLVLRGSWLNALLLGAFLAAATAFVAFDQRLPSLFDLLFVVAALLNAVGWTWQAYTGIPGYDEFAHFFTSFTVTLSLGFLVYRSVREPFRQHRLHFVLVIASFGISLGAFWEIFEWAILRELINPVVDIIMDSLGAVLAGFAAAWFLGVESEPDRAASSRTRPAPPATSEIAGR
jgi:hypothetical protein